MEETSLAKNSFLTSSESNEVSNFTLRIKKNNSDKMEKELRDWLKSKQIIYFFFLKNF